MVLPLSATSSGVARRFVASVTGSDEDSRVALIVTELVTNAVRHAHSQPCLSVTTGADEVIIEVTDDHPGRPVLRAKETNETSGRGLVLVDQMAEAWGVEPRDDGPGKVVWARVAWDG